MIEFTTTYILSQIFSTIGYILIGCTYFLKERRTLLIVSFFQSISLMIGYWFLRQYQGMLMVTVGIITNIMFFIDVEKNGISDKIQKKDVIMLIILLTYTAVLACVTYTNLLSLLSVLGTIAWLIAVWVKDIKLYKIIQIPTALFWLGFNAYAKSISGIITEIILFIVAICGLVLHIRDEKREEKIKEGKEDM